MSLCTPCNRTGSYIETTMSPQCLSYGKHQKDKQSTMFVVRRCFQWLLCGLGCRCGWEGLLWLPWWRGNRTTLELQCPLSGRGLWVVWGVSGCFWTLHLIQKDTGNVKACARSPTCSVLEFLSHSDSKKSKSKLTRENLRLGVPFLGNLCTLDCSGIRCVSHRLAHSSQASVPICLLIKRCPHNSVLALIPSPSPSG